MRKVQKKKFLIFRNMALSCTDSLPQAYGIENIALERVVRLVWVSVGLM